MFNGRKKNEIKTNYKKKRKLRENLHLIYVVRGISSHSNHSHQR